MSRAGEVLINPKTRRESLSRTQSQNTVQAEERKNEAGNEHINQNGEI